MPKRLTALGFAFRRFAVPGRVGARVFGFNIGCRYSTPVRERPLHPQPVQARGVADTSPRYSRDRAGATRRWKLNNTPRPTGCCSPSAMPCPAGCRSPGPSLRPSGRVSSRSAPASSRGPPASVSTSLRPVRTPPCSACWQDASRLRAPDRPGAVPREPQPVQPPNPDIANLKSPCPKAPNENLRALIINR